MSVVMVYITASSPEEAEKVGRLLVEKRLAACVNIIAGMRSIYWWEGKLDQAEETVLIAKTKESLVDELVRSVKDVHDYTVPCVVALPVVAGNPDFISWIKQETKGAE
ncbi:MAG: divalent-cation tolerance protein CutA [Thermodesulfobacteriota bacterium]